MTNTHEPIISHEMFDAVQNLREQVSQKTASRTVKPYTPNIFKGKVFCGHCGGALNRHRAMRKSMDDVYTFVCLSNSRKARRSCVPFTMPETELLNTLLTVIQAHAKIVVSTSVKLRKNSLSIDLKREQIKAELATLRMDTDKNGRIFKSLYESLVSGLITKCEYKEMRDNYEDKVSKSLARKQEIESYLNEFENQMSEYCVLLDVVQNNVKSGITGELVEQLIDRITIHPDRYIEVDFRFNSGFNLINEVACFE